MAKLTTEQWVAELQAIERATAAKSGDGMTVGDISEMTGRGKDKVRQMLKEAKRQGRLISTVGFREGINGCRHKTYLYKITPLQRGRAGKKK